MEAADDVNFGRAGVGGFPSGGDDLLDRHFVSAFLAALAIEGAELAGQGADVGIVDVPVAVKKRAVAVEFFADEIGEAADAVQIAGLIEG